MGKWLVAAAIAAVVIAVRAPAAGAGAWSYTYSCSDCSTTGGPITNGKSNTYATEAECIGARGDEDELAGLIGVDDNTAACVYLDADTPNNTWTPSNTSSSSASTSSNSSPSYTPPSSGGGGGTRGDWQLAAMVGPGWSLRDAAGLAQSGDGTAGLDLGAGVGSRAFHLRVNAEAIYTRLQHDNFGTGEQGLILVPVMVGIEVEPALHRGGVDVRLDVAASGGALFHGGCDACQGSPWNGNGSGTAELRGGLSFFWGRDHEEGLSIDAVAPFFDLGDPNDMSIPLHLVSPSMLVRVAWIHRQHDDD